MPYVELQIDFTRHDKVQAIPAAIRPKAVALFVATLGHCAEMLTDGHVSRPVLNEIGRQVGVKHAVKTAQVLQEVGLFEITNSGYVVHDYLDYQPSRAHVLETRKREAERKRQARRRNVPANVPANVPPGQPGGQIPDVRRDSRARGSSPPPTPEVHPEGDLDPAAAEEAARANGAAADDELRTELEHQGWTPQQIQQALADPDRAWAWYLKATHEADNIGAYAWTGFSAGAWPSQKPPTPAGPRKTGYRLVRGSHGSTYIRDPNGTDPLPAGYTIPG